LDRSHPEGRSPRPRFAETSQVNRETVVAGMKPDGNAHFAEPPRYLALGMIEQAGTDALPLKPGQHIEVLNLRMASLD